MATDPNVTTPDAPTPDTPTPDTATPDAPTPDVPTPQPTTPGEGDEQAGGDEPPTPPPAGPQQLSQKEVEARLDKLQREAERHEKRIEEVMENDAQTMLVKCPMCWELTPGFVFAADFNEQRRDKVRAFLGDRKPRELSHDPHSVLCEVCDGEGEVETGSRVKGYDVVPCLDCGGKGVRGERFDHSRPTGVLNGPPMPEVEPVRITGPLAPAPEPLPDHVLAELRQRGMMAIPVGKSTP